MWDASTYDFVSGDAPTSVNPSLWRQGQLVAKHGLFEVVEGLYQVRGFDLSVVSFIEGDTGVVVVDPLLTAEPAAAALALYRQHRGDRPIVAVVYTHSHIDHFGGVFGILTQEEVDSGQVPVVAPDGFLEHAIAENVYAGTAMSRRSAYMPARPWPAAQGAGRRGLASDAPRPASRGSDRPDAPSPGRARRPTRLTASEIEFQLAPGTEAPSEMHLYFRR